MDQDEQRLIDKEFEDLQDRIVQQLIDNGLNNPESPNYPLFEFWALGKGDWNTMVTKMANNYTEKIREERKPIMNRAMRRAANKKK